MQVGQDYADAARLPVKDAELKTLRDHDTSGSSRGIPDTPGREYGRLRNGRREKDMSAARNRLNGMWITGRRGCRRSLLRRYWCRLPDGRAQINLCKLVNMMFQNLPHAVEGDNHSFAGDGCLFMQKLRCIMV